jgi:hypothetical protein
MNLIKKTISLLIIVALITLNTVPVYAEATEASEANEADGETQTVQNTPAPTTTPTVNQQVVQSPSPSPSSSPTTGAAEAAEAPEIYDSSEELSSSEQKALERQASTNENNTLLDTPQYSPSGTSSSDNDGDTNLATGDANNDSNITTAANSNLASLGGCCPGGATVANTDNGANSTSNSSATLNNNNGTVQDNEAVVLNNLSQGAYTGGNKASDNDGEVELTTGDANVTGTILTAVNTNVAGVAVSEFNVNDYTGDIILDLPANCISGCFAGDTTVKNANNGDGSVNDATLNSTTNNFLTQDNDAIIESNLELFADTGTNTASDNDGDVKLTTGDANVSANVLTFANNNIAGNVWYGVVNIFGDLVGDIILPQSVIDSLTCNTCGGATTVANTGNGSESDNNTVLNQTTNNNIYQFNDAAIDNNLILDANTGGNTGSDNDGSVAIESGSANIDANVLNIANTNMIGGDWWLVIVNEAGNWIGQLIGAPGSNMAGSIGTEFVVDQNGAITVSNTGNGDNSQNNSTLNQTTNNNISQTNNVQVANNLNLGANTGLNTTSDNDGHSKITTGDANIVANLVNFVNNNIVGSGKVVPIVINVFGSWIGNFIAPGQEKPNNSNNQETNTAQGGQSNNSNSSSSSSNSQSSNAAINISQNQSNPVVTVITQNPVSQAAGGVAGVFIGSVAQVAGFKADAGDFAGLVGADKKKVKINLAWLVLVLPVAGGLVLIKRKTSLLNRLPRRK